MLPVAASADDSPLRPCPAIVQFLPVAIATRRARRSAVTSARQPGRQVDLQIGASLLADAEKLCI